MKKNYRGIGFYIGLVLIVILVWYLLGNSQDTAGAYTYAEFEKALDKDEVVHYTSFEALFESMLFFTTKRGYVKLVSGTEFETNRSVISATKLEPEDTIVSINQLCSHEVTAEDTRVFLLTKEGLSLTFPLEEVSQLKRSSRGVKGISLVGEDTVVFGAVFSPETTTISYNQKTLHIGKLKNRRRCARGQKNKL